MYSEDSRKVRFSDMPFTNGRVEKTNRSATVVPQESIQPLREASFFSGPKFLATRFSEARDNGLGEYEYDGMSVPCHFQ